MSNARNGERRKNKAASGRDAGGFVAIPWTVLDCPGYAGLSHPARSLLMEIARQYVRDNNGRLLASRAYLAKRGWKSNDVILRAKQELLEADFICEMVKGHRPNKASWYAITWQSLDRLPGFDSGAAAAFERGAYRKTPPIKNAALRPSNGAGGASIAPSHGAESPPPRPSHGAIEASFGIPSTPSHGHHLERPSAVVNAGSCIERAAPAHAPTRAAAPTLQQSPEVTERVRDCDQDPALFDPVTGDYQQAPSKPARQMKVAAVDWVASATLRGPATGPGRKVTQ
jgi:hypothetical protein